METTLDDAGKKRILIAFDGSPHSRDALVLGKQLCRLLDASPMVVICEVFPAYLSEMLDTETIVAEEGSAVLDLASDYFAPREIETRAVVHQSPARAIQELAERLDPLAVIVGSSHHGDGGRVLLSTVGKSLLAGSPSPIVVAPRGYAKHDAAVKRICVAIDEGPDSARALDEAIAIARLAGAHLTVVSVSGPTAASYGFAIGDMRTAQLQFTAKLLEEAADYIPREIPVTIKRLEGDPLHELEKISKFFNLMVVGSRSYGPVRRVLLGSVSAGLMSKVQCPLMVVPRHARHFLDLELTPDLASAGATLAGGA